MATKHTVREGEHLAEIAARHGFADPRTVFDDPANADLKKRRKNFNVLLAGDVVVIPDLDPRRESVADSQVHRFTALEPPLRLNLKLETVSGNAVADTACTMAVAERGEGGLLAGPPLPVETDAKGKLSQPVPAGAAEGELVVGVPGGDDDEDTPTPRKVRLIIGGLDPVDTVKGQQARLNNLGYFAGYTTKDADQLRWAIEEFQLEHGIKPNGRSDDRPTFCKLGVVHGDLLSEAECP